VQRTKLTAALQVRASGRSSVTSWHEITNHPARHHHTSNSHLTPMSSCHLCPPTYITLHC